MRICRSANSQPSFFNRGPFGKLEVRSASCSAVLDNDPAVDFDSLDCGKKLIAERVFGRARLKIVGGNHLGRRQRIAYDRTQPRFADTIALLAE